MKPLDIRISPTESEAGRPELEIATPAATYRYDLEGGGFSALCDGEGRDWIGYRPGGGPAGEYRGIPNLVYRGPARGFFHPGHSGEKASQSVWERSPDGSALVRSVADGGQREVDWRIRPRYALMTARQTHPGDPAYWFLYEGTPGGTFDLERSLCLRSTGETTVLAEQWEAALPSGAWVAFTDPERSMALVLWREGNESGCRDSYYPMPPMTVFGFGRPLRSIESEMTQAPARFAVALSPSAQREAIERVVDEIRADLSESQP